MQTENEIRQKKNLTISEAVGFSILLMGTVLAFWSNTQTRLALLELSQRNAESDRTRIEFKIDKMNLKIDDMKDGISEIRIIQKSK